MSATVGYLRDWKAHRRAVRARYGVACPRCRERQPKREPSILLPGQNCRADGYRDNRPTLTADQLALTDFMEGGD